MLLAEHHTEDDASFYVLFDRAATYGHPGEAQVVALHLQRDLEQRTFTLDRCPLPLASMAQSWLISRGCPREGIGLLPGRGTVAADETTVALEARLAGDGDHYALLCSYTDDLSDTPETTVLLRAVDERDPQPFRGLVEAVDLAAGTHTLRESRFTRPEEATRWWDRHWSRPRTGVPTAPPPAPSPAPDPPFTPSRSR